MTLGGSMTRPGRFETHLFILRKMKICSLDSAVFSCVLWKASHCRCSCRGDLHCMALVSNIQLLCSHWHFPGLHDFAIFLEVRLRKASQSRRTASSPPELRRVRSATGRNGSGKTWSTWWRNWSHCCICWDVSSMQFSYSVLVRFLQDGRDSSWGAGQAEAEFNFCVYCVCALDHAWKQHNIRIQIQSCNQTWQYTGIAMFDCHKY